MVTLLTTHGRFPSQMQLHAGALVSPVDVGLTRRQLCITSAAVLSLPIQRVSAEPAQLRLFTAPPEYGGFSMLVPATWKQLTLSPAGREVVGVYASFQDPEEASNTLGVYITDNIPQWCQDVRCLGTLQQRAAQLAGAAPGQRNQAARERRASDRVYYEIETLVGGGTAGRFGAAVECLGETVARGKRYQARATASLYSWKRPGTKDSLRACVASFTVL